MTTFLQHGVARMLPFGGYEHRGNGRQRGLEGFLQYLETKTVGLR
jgi:aldehyde dehydrogenase (NAD+)